MLNFNQLRVFFYAAKNLNFTAAAKDLFITQPAVTAQVKAFEASCNLKLFKKRGRRVYLTDEGKALYAYAKKIFEFEKEIENAVEDMKELKRGNLRLGTTKTYARYFMPFIISNCLDAYPEIKIHLNEGSSLDMIYSLLDIKNEVAIIAKAEDNPEVNFLPFSQEEMVVILPFNHPLSKKGKISFFDLADEPIIMKEIGSGTRKLVNELYAQNNCNPNVLMETSNTEFIKQLVQRGDGISFLVKEAVALELREKKLASVSLKGNKIFLDVSIAYLKNQHLSKPAKAFVDILRKLKPADMPFKGISSFRVKI
jgi:DNA-binding transcriptional LysR family regulator